MTITDDFPTLYVTLKRKLELKKLSRELRILNAARGELVEEGYDNWNGGQYYFTLYLDVPIEMFVEFENEIDKIEGLIKQEAESLLRGESDEHITKITIRSTPYSPPITMQLTEAGHEDSRKLWTPNCFRFFLTHASEQKSKAHQIKSE